MLRREGDEGERSRAPNLWIMIFLILARFRKFSIALFPFVLTEEQLW